MRVIQSRWGAAPGVQLDEFLTRPLFVHLATMAAAGPRVSPVWFLWEDGCVWMIGSGTRNSFTARVRDDPRCALSFIDFDRARGRVHHVSMRGRATVEPFDRDQAIRLVARYLGPDLALWDAGLRALMDDPDYVTIRFVPESVAVRDQSYVPSGI